VDRTRLSHLAGKALITESIEVDVGEALSRRDRLDIVAFPLSYVPITNRHGRAMAAWRWSSTNDGSPEAWVSRHSEKITSVSTSNTLVPADCAPAAAGPIAVN
jgi:hypothetical protein